MVALELSVAEVLPPDARSVRNARALLREALAERHPDEWTDRAELAVSELVTNAVVHAGTEVDLRVLVGDRTLRVEVCDGSCHEPVRRTYATTAGTGRGLHLIDQSVDRWDVVVHNGGKTVWFEIGQPLPGAPAAPEPPPQGEDTCHEVLLLHVPLLMHWAWQEHAAALLREYLLVRLDDDLDILERHAEASDALNLLHEQLPAPAVPVEADAIMADSVEPGVSAEQVVLRIPTASVAHFRTLDELLSAAVAMARAGDMLGPPTQPEISEMRQWLCRQVADQVGGAEPVAWHGRADVCVRAIDPDRLDPYRELSASPEPLIATDEGFNIVAVTPSVVEFLGYADASELLGRRIIVVVPERYRQAHVAGTTLHSTNGRDVLLGIALEVPVLRADGSEVTVELTIRSERFDGARVFVARFRLDRP